MEKILIEAPENMYFTDGEIYGKQIWLAEGRSPKEFWMITEEEYQEILKAEEEKYNYEFISSDEEYDEESEEMEIYE
jgi:hypothetical protein